MVKRARRILRRALMTVLWRVADRLGHDVLERSYYSPIVDAAALPTELWSQPRVTPGLTVDVEAQLAFLERDLAPHLTEFDPPRERSDAGGFYLHNGYYGPVDAQVLYAIIRHVKPARMIELGSGFSTLVALAAHQANVAEGKPCDYRIFDPYVGDHSQVPSSDLVLVRRMEATSVALSEFAALEAGDIVFIDTTHTVKPAGDVNYLLLEVLPILRPGVIVHVHDVFLPWEYPRHWIVGLRRHWTEQYLLQALLCCNPCFELLFCSHAAARAAPERLRTTVPSFNPASLELTAASTDAFTPAAFWLRRTDEL